MTLTVSELNNLIREEMDSRAIADQMEAAGRLTVADLARG